MSDLRPQDNVRDAVIIPIAGDDVKKLKLPNDDMAITEAIKWSGRIDAGQVCGYTYRTEDGAVWNWAELVQ